MIADREAARPALGRPGREHATVDPPTQPGWAGSVRSRRTRPRWLIVGQARRRSATEPAPPGVRTPLVDGVRSMVGRGQGQIGAPPEVIVWSDAIAFCLDGGRERGVARGPSPSPDRRSGPSTMNATRAWPLSLSVWSGVDEQVGVRGDRVGRRAGAVDDRRLPGSRPGSSATIGLGGGGDAVGRAGDELAVGVLDVGRGDLRLGGVLELDVADRARRSA